MEAVKKRRLAIFLALAFIAAVVLGCFAVAYGWFEVTEDKDGDIGFGSVKSVCDVYFMSGGSKHDASGFLTEGGIIEAELIDATAVNYYGNLRVDLIVRATASICARVRITEMWTNDRGEIARMPYTHYTVDAANHSVDMSTGEPRFVINDTVVKEGIWYDNRKKDLSFYYFNTSAADAEKWYINMQDEPSEKVIRLIEGVTFTEPTEGSRLRIRFVAETVQFNRYRELWHLDSYPGLD